MGVDAETEPPADSILAELVAAARTGDDARAYRLATDAIEKGLRHPMLYNARATWLLQHGQYTEALADFESAREFAPRNPLLWSAIGTCFMRLTQWREAIAAYDSAIAAAPGFAQAHYHRGVALQMLGNRNAAKAALERAVELKADFANALGSLALLSIGEGNGAEARIRAGRALACDARQSTALIALLLADFNDGLISAAEHKVREFLDHANFGEDPHANNMLGQVADMVDRHGNARLAFETYTALHKRRREIHAARFANSRAADNVVRLAAYFRKTDPWPPARTARLCSNSPAEHVFLLGFARSGTTLLETILATNERVAVLDERDCFPTAAKELLQSEAGIHRLATIGDDDLECWREAYWKTVRDFGVGVAGKAFVDKWPFNSYRMPLIAKLFPSAKILFARRDPRDVVLSCFRRRFIVNADTFEFLLLEDCARFYAGVMDLAEEFQRKLPVRRHDHRYEDLITDFDSAMRAVCDFIGIKWSKKMRDFSGSAECNIDPTAQSRDQLRRGLYAGAAGQWRRFKEDLGPILPILQPWVDRFGYSLD